MRKIFNWTFGACFRTLGRFLAIFIVGVLLIFIGSKIGIELPDWLALNVKATNLSNWAEGLPVLSRIDYKSCNSSSCSTDISTIYLPFFTSNGDRQAVYNSTDFDVGKNGYNIVIQSPNMKPGYLYETNFYYCTYSNITNDLDMISAYIGSHSQYSDNSIYNNTTTIQIGNIPGNEDLGFSRCYRTVSLNVPQYQSNNNWYNYRLRKDSGVFNDLRLVAISYEVNELGIYTSEIAKIIEDSGLASAESVSQVQESVNQVEQEIQQTQDTITNEDTTGAEDSASGFFNDFTTETFGLTAIITAPLNAINSLISSTCSPLVFPLPYVDKNLSLPCMSSIYNEFFGGFFSIYQLITTGIISYYVIVRIFNLVKDFKNPDHDEIEVVDL